MSGCQQARALRRLGRALKPNILTVCLIHFFFMVCANQRLLSLIPLIVSIILNPTMSRPYHESTRQKSLHLKESTFYEAAIGATSCHGDDLNDDPNALNDTDKMAAIGRSFLEQMAPSLLQVLDHHPDSKSTLDRLVKIGRNISCTLRHQRRSSLLLPHSSQQKELTERQDYTYPINVIDSSLGLLADECSDLAELLRGKAPKVPRVRFGKTELHMPVVSLGCMRFQQSWNRDGQKVLDMVDVDNECQENLVRILEYAIECGVNHIETAKGYGSSQLQIGYALKSLFDSGVALREDLIIQTKGGVSSSMTIADYKQQILNSIDLLQLDYVDLFSMHGLNTQAEYDLLFNNPKGNLIIALQELKQEGKIRYFGFSTHGPADLIRKAIETDVFDYVNLHYHFCGSYTTTGDGDCGGNLSNIRLANKKDMGVFIISAYDKGGRLYAPSNKLRSLCLPDMEPITYGSIWLWHHALHDPESASIHTLVVGAARPSDLDQPILASHLLLQDQEEVSQKRESITSRLNQSMVDTLGKEWVDTWHFGLPNAYKSNHQTHLTGIVWTYNLIKAWGMLDFAKDRYETMEKHLKKWDAKKSKEENLKNIGSGFGWVPGCALDFENLDYSGDLENCPEENREKILEAMHFVHDWTSKQKENKQCPTVPLDWQTAYDMRPWTAFPER